MRMYDIIQKKRNGGELTDAEIQWVISGYTRGELPDYQISAWLMAVWFRGMSVRETLTLTLAIRDSGERLQTEGIDGIRVDKHSTGGVGDKTSLVVAPVVASLGLKVAKMSGRGLGHTGGTVDKLEAFSGLRTDLSADAFIKAVNSVGVAIVGQSADLAPADKLLYALRDVTATVDSLPLIASSIMGKKLAADDDCIVLDVKTGSGAFMKSLNESRELAELMVSIGKQAGKRICALLTDMDTPLGRTVGNTLEVVEAIETLQGRGPEDLSSLCVALSARMLYLSGRGSYEECEAQVCETLRSGLALQTLADMVAAQGGDPTWVFDTEKFPKAVHECPVCAPRSGYVTHVDAEGYGVSALMLGAGRNTKSDRIDMTAGIRLLKKTGDAVQKDEPFAVLYTTDKPEQTEAAAQKLLDATEIGDTVPELRPLIFDVIS